MAQRHVERACQTHTLAEQVPLDGKSTSPEIGERKNERRKNSLLIQIDGPMHDDGQFQQAVPVPTTDHLQNEQSPR